MSKRIITFGTWDGKPIEWIVLKEELFATLVIGRLTLFSLELSWNGQTGTWKDSSLRKYLNGDFYNKAFTSDEKKKILNIFLEDPEGTKDDIFLLSYEEANTLMTQSERRFGDGNCSFPCKNCYKNINKKGTCWYLRTPYNSSNLREVNSQGTIDNNYSHDGGLSIRPAMWIREK